MPRSPLKSPAAHVRYCSINGLSSPSCARRASMTAASTAPLSPYSSVTASLPARCISAKDMKVMPMITGISCNILPRIYFFKAPPCPAVYCRRIL